MKDISEYLPIKLSPGFITVAYHFGCIGCNFCSVRYGNKRDDLFKAGLHKKYPTNPHQILKFLEIMPSFFQAKIPLRIGNDTDYRFESRETLDLLNSLQPDYPVAILTRFPLQTSDQLVFSRNNVILKITATPLSNYLKCPDNSEEIIKSIEIAKCPVMLTIGPITADNYESAAKLIDQVPKASNISIHIKALNDEFDASLAAIPKASEKQIYHLKEIVQQSGFRHLSHLSCPLNHNLRLGHERVSDIPDTERIYCSTCSSKNICYSDDILDIRKTKDLLSRIGLTLLQTPSRRAYKSYYIEVSEPTGLGDEAFLSEMLGSKIKLSGTVKGTDNFRYSASKKVLNRWQKVSFFPYEQILEVVQDFLKSSFSETEKILARRS